MTEDVIQCGDLICAVYDAAFSITDDASFACCLAALSTLDLVARSDNPELLIRLLDS